MQPAERDKPRSGSDPLNLVLVGYTETNTREAISVCERAFDPLKLEHKVLVINDPSLRPALNPRDWTILIGSNTLGEFSGWNEGLIHLSTIGSRASTIFANDTIGGHRHPSVFRRWAFAHEVRHTDQNSIVGFTDSAAAHDAQFKILGMLLTSWVSTYLFMLPHDILDKFGFKLYELAEINACVTGEVDLKAFFSDQLSPDLQRYLRWWLFGGGWLRSVPLTEATAPAMILKARCICAELIIAARCSALGLEKRDPLQRHIVARALDYAGMIPYRFVKMLRGLL